MPSGGFWLLLMQNRRIPTQSSFLIRPKKDISHFLFFLDVLRILKSHFFNFLAAVQGPRLSGRLREVSAMNLVYVSSNSEVVGPSYDNFYEQLNGY